MEAVEAAMGAAAVAVAEEDLAEQYLAVIQGERQVYMAAVVVMEARSSLSRAGSTALLEMVAMAQFALSGALIAHSHQPIQETFKE
jgi:hypothetical protein